MKAIQVEKFGDSSVLKIQQVADPRPGDDEVLIRVHAIGVNPVETYIRSGNYGQLPELPYIPGHDTAGTVEAMGEKVQGFRIGQRVYTAGTVSGAYAERTLAKQSRVHPLPDPISFEQGAALGVPYGTACRALFYRAKAKPGDWVLVHGATGGVGIAAVQLAVARGMLVIGTGGTQEGCDLVEQQGAIAVLNHTQSGYLGNIQSITGGAGIDVIVEMLANVNLGHDMELLSPGGRVIVVGSRGTVQVNPRDLMSRDAAVMGMAMPNTSQEDYARIHAELGAGLKNGSLHPVISQKIPLEDAASAHERVMSPGAKGKIILTV